MIKGEKKNIKQNDVTIYMVKIDKHTTDEMSYSNYNYKLQGKMKLVKANACMHYKEFIKEATNERHQEDFNKKHNKNWRICMLNEEKFYEAMNNMFV